MQWEFWLKDMPMPEDATYEIMWSMVDALELMNYRDYAAEQIKWYENLWLKYIPRYKADPDNENLIDIMKMIKNGILMWREELTK
jgi:hypothetical protein